MVGIVARRPVRFLAKAPLFEVPVFGNILHALGMMPAYRRSDDPSQTHRNLESLSQAAARLKGGEAIGIFPEGKSHDAPRLEQVKTGAARMAIQAVREGAVGLKLVPVGLNYERKEMFRSAIWIRVGEPIDVNAWLANMIYARKDVPQALFFYARAASTEWQCRPTLARCPRWARALSKTPDTPSARSPSINTRRF